MRNLTRMLCALSFSFLAACQFVTDYKYTPPQASIGKMCVMECLAHRTQCKHACDMRHENCDVNADENAYYRYLAYHDEQMASHEKETQFVMDKHQAQCFDCVPCRCEINYNICYQDCGGKVTPIKKIL